MDNARTAHELVKDFVEDWPEFNTAPDEHPEQGDEPVSGADLVDYMAGFFAEAKTALEKAAKQ